MKLYLSSYRIPDSQALIALTDKTAEDIRVALIPNAKDYYAERARNVKLQESIEYFRSRGLASEVVDLREYRNPDELRRTLQAYDVIWAVGGNTFCLRHEMQASGFDIVVKDLLEQGIVYGGDSAGACVVGTTLKGLEGADDPAFSESVIWEGLALVPHFILPHVDNLLFAEDTTAVRALYKDDPSLLELTDSQAFVVGGDKTQLITGTRQ